MPPTEENALKYIFLYVFIRIMDLKVINISVLSIIHPIFAILPPLPSISIPVSNRKQNREKKNVLSSLHFVKKYKFLHANHFDWVNDGFILFFRFNIGEKKTFIIRIHS